MENENMKKNENLNESINDLEIEDLVKGYTYNPETNEYRCLFCKEIFEEGYIYEYEEKLMSAEKRMKIHIEEEHNGVFLSLLGLEKEINGLSDIQKKLLLLLAEKKDNKDIAEDMGITTSTVRTHKFYLQKMKRQAKILLALMEALEIEEKKDKKLELKNERDEKLKTEKIFSINSLHPFFTQYNLK